MPCIYKIQNKINNKVYIGQTKMTLEWRLNHNYIGHFTRAFKLNIDGCLYNALRKYGKDAFTYEVIEEVTKEILDERETYWIAYYDSYNKGYNRTLGGVVLSKTQQSNRKGAILSEETKRKISDTLKRKNTIEYRQMISEKTKKAMARPEIKEKYLKAISTVEYKEKQSTSISKALKGRMSPNKGKTASEETKRKISDTLKRKNTIEYRQMISEKTKKAMARPEIKEKLYNRKGTIHNE